MGSKQRKKVIFNTEKILTWFQTSPQLSVIPEDIEKMSLREKVGLKNFYTQPSSLSNVQASGQTFLTTKVTSRHVSFLKEQQLKISEPMLSDRKIQLIVACEPSINVGLKIWFIKHVFSCAFAFHLSQLTDVTIRLKSKKKMWEKSNIASVGNIMFHYLLFFQV